MGSVISDYFFFLFLFLFFFLFVVDFVIHWNETAMGLHVLPIPIPPRTSLSTRSLQVFPLHQVRALVSCIQPGLVIRSTLDNIYQHTILNCIHLKPSLSGCKVTCLPHLLFFSLFFNHQTAPSSSKWPGVTASLVWGLVFVHLLSRGDRGGK